MKIKKVAGIIGFVLGVLLVLGPSSYAYECGVNNSKDKGSYEQSKQQHRQRMQQQLEEELKLTSQQKEQLQQFRQQHFQAMKELKQQTLTVKKELKASLDNADVTRDQVQTIADKLKALEAQKIDARIDSIFEVKQVLTPEQFAQFQQIMKDKMEKHRSHKRWRHKKSESQPTEQE